MEDTSKIHEKLNNSANQAQAREELIEFIKTQLHYFKNVTDHTFESAYTLAGLLGTDYVRGLPDTDPIVRVLSLAGELEIAPSDSKELAAELVSAIEAL